MFAVMLLLVLQPAYGENWKFVGTTTPDHDAYAVDMDSITDDAGFKYAWEKTTFKHSQVDSSLPAFDESLRKSANLPNDYNMYIVEKALFVYNCRNRSSQILETIKYKNDGTILNTLHFPMDSTRWDFAVPGSIGIAEMQLVCAHR